MKNLIIILFVIFLIAKDGNTQSTWIQQNSGVNSGLLSIKMLDQNTGYISGASGKILKTTNSGVNWFSLNSGTLDSLHSIFFVNVDLGYVCGNNGKIMKTTNGGINWINLSSGTTNTLKQLKFLNDNFGVMVGYGGRVLKTTNGGINWINLNTGYTNDIWSIDLLNENIFTISTINGRIFSTVDGGLNWSLRNLGSNYELTFVKYLDESNILIGVGIPANPNLFRTSNNGQNWVNQNLGSQHSIRFIDFPTRKTGFIVGDDGDFYRSVDSGKTWTYGQINSPVWNYSCSFINENTGWIVGTQGKILKTTTAGAVIPNAPTNLVGFLTQNETIYLSWFDNSTNEEGFKIERSLGNQNNFELIATVPANSFSYTDANIMFNSLYFYRITAFSGSMNSNYSNVVSVSTTNIENISNNIPTKIELYQNYPNPFNPETKINFDIAKTSNVSLIVFNSLGESVMTLVDNKMFNAGSYSYNLNLSNIKSGIYFYRLIAGDYSETKKMILLK
ncbi:MAG: T9SS type A sorting domain-containing protein [Ignavibacteria bacterium]|nr:T9SS type A sorting domain-containing protein [Ignavibacteria bacterium]